SGVRTAGATREFHEAVRLLGVPVTTGNAPDLIADAHPLYCGRPGIFGQRRANFVVQNSDALLVLGASLHIRQISYNWTTFARLAYKMRVDVDATEFDKPLVRADLAIHSDLKVFLAELVRQLRDEGFDGGRHAPWVAWCRERVERYPVVQPRHR